MSRNSPAQDVSRQAPAVLFAKKDLEANTRIARQCRVLEESGQPAVVVCERPPIAAQSAAIPGVRFLLVSRKPGLRDIPVTLRILGTLWLARVVGQERAGRLLKQVIRAGVAGRRASDAPGGTAGHATGVSGGARGRGLRRMATSVLRPFTRLPLAMVGLALASDVAFARRALAALQAEAIAPGMVQAHDLHTLPAAAEAARAQAVPLIYDAVEAPLEQRNWWALGHDQGERRVRHHAATVDTALAPDVRAADTVFTVSAGLARWMESRYGCRRPVLLRNFRHFEAADPAASPLRRACGLVAGQRLVLQLNTVCPGEGVEVLLDALARLPDDVHLAFLGPPPDPDYAGTLKQHGAWPTVAGRVHFLDPVPSDAVVSWAAGADAGVIARQDTCLNNRISLPNRIFEFLMAGLPVAVSSLPDIAEFVRDTGMGLVFDETDPASVAETLEHILAPGTQSPCRARAAEVARSLNWEQEAETYRQTLADLATPPSGS